MTADIAYDARMQTSNTTVYPSTKTGCGSEWAIDDRVTHLRDWATLRIRPLPLPPTRECWVGTGLMPDITNLTRLHLYEIKPFTAQGLGAAKASMCVGLFGRAGIAMQLGPMAEPGTSGGLPAPDGVYMFWSPEPGVIVYSYRKGRLVPVPVPEAEPATERRWRFELQPLTPQQRQAVTTFTIGAALLLAAMILLSPVGI